MKLASRRTLGIVLLVCGVTVRANAPVERVIYIDPPLHLLTQCVFRELKNDVLTCTLDGWPRSVALGPKAPLWKGKDYPDLTALRTGDLLDIKLGLDSNSREVATFIWANLVQIEGVLGKPGGGQWFSVQPLIPYTVGELSGQRVFAWVDRDTTIVGGSSTRELQAGRAVIVIGERWDNQRIRATRIALSTR